jgi:tRNA threonylcarbamoyladenosine biosynthesis protein TsaE
VEEVHILRDPSAWLQWAKEHAADLAGIVSVRGEMGAGKTTAISYWLRAMGSPDRASSPTFALVNEYESPDGPIYHFDLHRLDRPSEVAAMGFEDYLDSGQPCWVEWPERAGELMPVESARVHIEALEDGARKVTFVGTYR